MSTILFDEIVFGPVHSRRLGVSLGMNLLPVDGKVCSFDCIYCECGYNVDHRAHKGLPTREEVYEALDGITFAGIGEPTLHPQFAAIIDDTMALRNIYYPDAKVSVLSNATRIDRPDVFDALNKVDNNILKLDSCFDETIHLIDVPTSASFSVEKLIEGLCRFKGNLIVQTLFLQGEHNGKIIDNTTEKELLPWLEALRRIAPQEVMIYTIDRETPEKALRRAAPEKLDEIARRVEAMGIKAQVSY